jgi:hypothetical protein
MSGKHHAKYKKVDVELPDGKLVLYTGQKVRNAFHELMDRMDVYEFTRFQIAMKAVHDHGRKEGRREVIEKLENQFDDMKETTNYLPPGRPKD